jgi:hypothetical protein
MSSALLPSYNLRLLESDHPAMSTSPTDTQSLNPTASRALACHDAPSPSSLTTLSFELKARIFRCLQAAYIPEPDQHLQEAKPGKATSSPLPVLVFNRTWTHLAFACASMYAAAIQAPELWTTLDCHWRPEYVNMCIERANQLPLRLIHAAEGTVTFRSDEHRDDYRRLIYRCYPLAREVYLGNSRVATDSLESIMSVHVLHVVKSAPLLEVLHLTGIRCVAHLKDMSAPSSILQFLTLTGGLLEWNDDSPSLPALQKLRITGTDMFDRKTLARLFTSCPSLRVLHLEDLKIANLSGAIHVAVPCLEALTICDNVYLMYTLLHMIHAPHRRLSLDVRGSAYPGTPSGVTGATNDVVIISAVMKFWQARTDMPMRGTLTLTQGHQHEQQSRAHVPHIEVHCALEALGLCLVYKTSHDVRNGKCTHLLLQHIGNIVIRGDVQDVQYLRLISSSRISSVSLEDCNRDNVGEKMKEWLRMNEGIIRSQEGQH